MNFENFLTDFQIFLEQPSVLLKHHAEKYVN